MREGDDDRWDIELNKEQLRRNLKNSKEILKGYGNKKIVVYPNDILTTPTKTDLKLEKYGRIVYDIKTRRWIRFIKNQMVRR